MIMSLRLDFIVQLETLNMIISTAQLFLIKIMMTTSIYLALKSLSMMIF